MAHKIKVGDIGTVFEIPLSDQAGILDISLATTLEINFKPPVGAAWTATASLTTDGTDGKLEYAFIVADLDEDGAWKAEAFVVLPSGQWTSDCIDFTVYPVCVV